MNLSPQDVADVKRQITEILAERAIHEAGSAADLVVLPIAAIA